MKTKHEQRNTTKERLGNEELASAPWCWVCAVEKLRGSKMKIRRKLVNLADTIIAIRITIKGVKGMSLNKKRSEILAKEWRVFIYGVQFSS